MSRAVKIIPVILCGGSGSRLWPLSRASKPKQFLKLCSNRSLVQETVLRAQAASGAENHECVFVTLSAIKGQLEKQLSAIGQDYNGHILCEPSARNTAAAVAFAACYVENEFGGDAVMWVLPSDHYIRDQQALALSLASAIDAAQENQLVTFGIKPTGPETGYGYIHHDNKKHAEGVFRAKGFVEKPDLPTAQAYVDSGEYLWNSGMFVFTAQKVLESFESFAPETLVPLQGVVRNGQRSPAPALYNEIPKAPFDKAIMEKSPDIAVVPCDMGWSDIGSWDRLFENYRSRLFTKRAA